MDIYYIIEWNIVDEMKNIHKLSKKKKKLN